MAEKEESTLIGIKVEYFEEFCRRCGLTDGSLTGPGVQAVVKQLTSETQKSLLSHVRDGDMQGFEDMPVGFIAEPNVFLSHSWRYFLRADIITAVNSLKKREPDSIVWFDLFSVPQHGGAAKPFSWWCETFFDMIKTIGKVVMVMLPYDKPVALTRAWCVFELYGCIATGSEFEVVMPDGVRETFLRALREDVKVFWKVIGGVRTAECEAGDPSDKERIGEVIKQAGGYGRIDAMVVGKLKEWLIRMLEGLVADATGEQRAAYQHTLGQVMWLEGRYGEAEGVLKEALEVRQRELGGEHRDTLWTMTWLGRSFSFGGKAEAAEAVLVKCVEKLRKEEGADGFRTLAAVNDLGWLYGNSLGKFEEAEGMLKDCLMRCESTLGESDDLTLSAMGNLALIYGFHEDDDKAAALQEQVLERRKTTQGENHPESLTAMNNLATTQNNQKKHRKAEALLKQVLERRKEVLGEGHPSTLSAMTNLGATYCHQERYAEALELLEECVAKMSVVHPAHHQHRQSAEEWLRFAREAVGGQGSERRGEGEGESKCCEVCCLS